MEKKSSGIMVRILLVLIGGIFIFEALFTNLKIMFIEAPLIGRESFSLQGIAYLAENNKLKYIFMAFTVLMAIFGIISFVNAFTYKTEKRFRAILQFIGSIIGAICIIFITFTLKFNLNKELENLGAGLGDLQILNADLEPIVYIFVGLSLLGIIFTILAFASAKKTYHDNILESPNEALDEAFSDGYKVAGLDDDLDFLDNGGVFYSDEDDSMSETKLITYGDDNKLSEDKRLVKSENLPKEEKNNLEDNLKIEEVTLKEENPSKNDAKKSINYEDSIAEKYKEIESMRKLLNEYEDEKRKKYQELKEKISQYEKEILEDEKNKYKIDLEALREENKRLYDEERKNILKERELDMKKLEEEKSNLEKALEEEKKKKEQENERLLEQKRIEEERRRLLEKRKIIEKEMEEKRKELEKLDREFIKKESPKESPVIENKESNSTEENLEETKKISPQDILKKTLERDENK